MSIECIPSSHWTIGGTLLAEKNSAALFLEVKVTEGTNTKNEKAAYIEAVFKVIASLLGNIEPASYIVIQEVRADAWGYGGTTQESRYIKGKPL